MGDISEDLCAIQRSQGVDSDGKRANQQVVLPSTALEDGGKAAILEASELGAICESRLYEKRECTIWSWSPARLKTLQAS